MISLHILGISREASVQGEVSEGYIGGRQGYHHAEDANAEGYRNVLETFAVLVGMTGREIL